jgi:Mor family transcriptional regulator
MNLWDDISMDDLKEDDISLLAGIVGMDAFKKIIEVFGGDSVYIPKVESVIRMGRDRMIYKEFKEKYYSYRALGVKYNLSIPHVRVIIKTQRKLKFKIKERQLELF